MRMWVAREPYGKGIECFKDKPYWDENAHEWVGGCIGSLSREIYPEVTFENSPKEVELKLIEK